MEKRNTFSMSFYLKKTVINKSGESPIYLRIYYNGGYSSISLHRSINAELWNTETGTPLGTSKAIKELAGYLLSVKSTVFEHFKHFRESGEPFTVTDIRNTYLGIASPTDEEKKLLELFLEHNERIKALENIDFVPSTVKRYVTTFDHIQAFIKHQYQKDDLNLSALNYQFACDLEVFLKTRRGCSHNTAMKYIKNLKKIIRIAIANGDLSQDPFYNFRVKPKNVDRGYLTEEELDMLMQRKFGITRIEEVRDCFVFSCFTGLAYSDLLRLSKDNIVTGTDGGSWIKINRKKTSKQSSIPVLSVTGQLLDKYKNHPYCQENNVILPVCSNQKMNAYLKEIADICGIKKKFTSHLARHTFATTVTLNNNVPIETVSKMLGHSSLEMTRIYARLLDKKVGQDMKHLNERYRMSS
ncbi:MAG TPA: site-specific integrase [Bacteroidales bacterium]|nr:site-specific integrase [Bacteroidales bacterium]